MTGINCRCARCQDLETELGRLVQIHDDRMNALRREAETASAESYQKLLSAESDAGIDLRIARGELYRHRLHHRWAN